MKQFYGFITENSDKVFYKHFTGAALSTVKQGFIPSVYLVEGEFCETTNKVKTYKNIYAWDWISRNSLISYYGFWLRWDMIGAREKDCRHLMPKLDEMQEKNFVGLLCRLAEIQKKRSEDLDDYKMRKAQLTCFCIPVSTSYCYRCRRPAPYFADSAFVNSLLDDFTLSKKLFRTGVTLMSDEILTDELKEQISPKLIKKNIRFAW